MTSFDALGLNSTLLKTLVQVGHSTPTPIQREAIPHVLAGSDLMGLAQTGTGKTVAFGLPVIQNLMSEGTKPRPKTARALVLAPTRELVNQIAVSLRVFVRPTHLKIQSVVGGASLNVQARNLERGTDILIATPGRLLDLVKRKAVSLAETRILVLDEADQMLDLGFIHPLRQIAGMVAKPRQTLLFSATMPKTIADLSREFQADPVRVEVTPPGKAADKVTQSVHLLSQRGKLDKLRECLSSHPKGLSLVFGRTKHGAEKLKKQLVAAGFEADSIHGNKSQGQRERAIKAFREGSTRVLVATDVAARGIDIPGVTHVYNFDLPEVADVYVHRIGRTARAGAEGEAISFCAAHETHLLKAIEKLVGVSVPVASRAADASDVDANAAPRRISRRPARRGSGDSVQSASRNKRRTGTGGQNSGSGRPFRRKKKVGPATGRKAG